jgi:hypothetical protein
MPGLSEQQLAQYLDEVTHATREGLIRWRSANPTTYYWDKMELPKARLSLQQVTRRQITRDEGRQIVRTVNDYIFQVFEFPPEGGLVQREEINGGQYEALNKKLGSLFEYVRSEKAQKDLEFLKGTLPSRK